MWVWRPTVARHIGVKVPDLEGSGTSHMAGGSHFGELIISDITRDLRAPFTLRLLRWWLRESRVD